MSELNSKRRLKPSQNKLEALKARLELRLTPAPRANGRRTQQPPA